MRPKTKKEKFLALFKAKLLEDPNFFKGPIDREQAEWLDAAVAEAEKPFEDAWSAEVPWSPQKLGLA